MPLEVAPERWSTAHEEAGFQPVNTLKTEENILKDR